MVISQRTAHLRYLHQNDNQKEELNENQVDVLKILGVDNVEVKDVDR
jgi:hypothetical protein